MDANFGIFREVKFSWIVKFLQFYLEFIFIVFKYEYPPFIVPAVEIERFAVILPNMKSINQYKFQSAPSNSGIVLF